MITIEAEMQAMTERLFFTKLMIVIFFAPSYFFSGAAILLTLFGTETSYRIKAIPNIAERI
jgi:hypothetical protein